MTLGVAVDDKHGRTHGLDFSLHLADAKKGDSGVVFGLQLVQDIFVKHEGRTG